VTSAATWTVAPDGRRLLLDGRPTFLLADTCWAAFGRVTNAEWEAYLRFRHRQGFNAVNVSMLPIAHDQSVSPNDPAPFAVRSDGSWDLDRPDGAWFRRARTMSEVALRHGITPVIVVLWCTYVPGTWAARLAPGLDLTPEQTDRYVDAVLDAVGDLPVILCISGDDRLEDDLAVDRYVRVLDRIHTARPDRLTTLRTAPTHETPARLLGHPGLGFYIYQSSHGPDGHHVAQRLGERYRALPVWRPILDLEPCYEGYASNRGTGRHLAASVRRSSWTSVLAGAGAGLGYGAHGVWSWHREGDRFLNEAGSGLPFPADVALQFPGAWDVGLLRDLVERFDLFDLTGRPDLLVGEQRGVRVGWDDPGGQLVIYLPEPSTVTLAIDLTGWDAEVWNLADRRVETIRWDVSGGQTVIRQPDALNDLLVVFSR
jgi:hypothetical protein